jgi:crossover junction endodeoxyribonuclease RuvC
MTVVGLDLSLTSTGLSHGVNTVRVEPRRLTGWDRLRFIADRVTAYCIGARPELVVIEGPAFSRQGSGQHERGGLWWFVTERLDDSGYPLAVAAPTALKKYATGKGNVGKDEMVLAAARRFDWFEGGNDEADALWLAAMGADYLNKPLLTMPALNRTALDKVQWPASVAAA